MSWIKVQLHSRKVRLKSANQVKYWTLRWRGSDGRQYSESIGKIGQLTRNEAQTLRSKKEAAINDGRISRDRPSEMTLAEFREHDLQMVKSDVKPNTVEAIRHAGDHALAALGDHIRLSRIGHGEIAVIKKHVLEKAKASPATLAKTLRTLKAMFNRAVEQGFIHTNPFRGVKMPKTQSRSKRIFSAKETAAMREVSGSAWWKTFILLSESTGLRKSELLNLMWRDIDFETNTVRIRA